MSRSWKKAIPFLCPNAPRSSISKQLVQTREILFSRLAKPSYLIEILLKQVSDRLRHEVVAAPGFWSTSRAWGEASNGGALLIHYSPPLEVLLLLQEKLQPYIADVRLTRGQGLIEIDGLLAAILQEVQQVLATSKDLPSC